MKDAFISLEKVRFLINEKKIQIKIEKEVFQ